MELNENDIENIKFCVLLAIQSINKAPSKQLRLMKINKVQAINELENLLKKFK